MNCFCETTASARLWLYLKRLYFISSAIVYCISPYVSFYAGLSCSILDLSKITMYRFHYQQIIAKYGNKAKLTYTHTDSFIYLFETKNIYDNMTANIDAFDTSEYPITHPLHSKKNAKTLGKFKDECNSFQPHEFKCIH